MKRALCSIAALLTLLSVAAFGQSQPPYQATSYQWRAAVLVGNTSTGTASVTLIGAPGQSGPQLNNGATVAWSTVFSTLAPVAFQDANAESVTPTAVSIAPCPSGNLGVGSSSTCATITGSFTYTHGQSAPVIDASFGLQTALNAANAAGGGVVALGRDWYTAGGTSALTAAAK